MFTEKAYANADAQYEINSKEADSTSYRLNAFGTALTTMLTNLAPTTLEETYGYFWIYVNCFS